jgi:hypothetical protein
MGSGGPAVEHSHPYRALRNIYVNNMKVILVRNIHLLSPPVRVGPRSFVTVAWLNLRVITYEMVVTGIVTDVYARFFLLKIAVCVHTPLDPNCARVNA